MLRMATLALSVVASTANRASAFRSSPTPLGVRARRCVASPRLNVGYSCDGPKALHGDDDAGAVQWEVHEVKGDGRCLFRSVSVARALSKSGRRQSEVDELASADELRAAAVNELLERREETEWFIEGDFDDYVARMQQPMAWGGEPEIIMLTHVLASPISVYMAEGVGMRSIGVYGEDYADSAQYDDLAVLFHGAGHYEALRVFGRA